MAAFGQPFLFQIFVIMRSHSYLNSAKKILNEYDGSMPFANWLKQYFKSNKKFGSKDRKEISNLCYCFFRLGYAFQTYPVEEKILLGLFLSTTEKSIVLEELKPEWNKAVHHTLSEKILMVDATNEIDHLFHFNEELSVQINKELFQRSFLVQPHLYLRIRPGKQDMVFNTLQRASVDFTVISHNCIALANSTGIDKLIELDRDTVVQDLNSQRIMELFPPGSQKHKTATVWDCCAASGGKSIMLYDTVPHAHLTVSDIRQSILQNLYNRFKRAGIKHYDAFVADVSDKDFSISKKFSLVICDAPCSGSGTWSRTPEQLLFFKKEQIDHYTSLQKKIALNAAKAVDNKGHFLYITCSVFTKENEEVVASILKHTSLQLENSVYFKGYEKRADTLFAALFRL